MQFNHAISVKFSWRFISKCDCLEYDAVLVKVANCAVICSKQGTELRAS